MENCSMIKPLKSLFIESSARWLIYILAVEYLIATNLSPTILTDYPILNKLVEFMAFVPAIHNFDKIATHPEAVQFYIALGVLLVIPKSYAVYDWLKKNPNREMRQYVISPLTDIKPASSRQIWTDGGMSEEQIKQQPTKPRSMASRMFWSIMILLFAVGCVVVLFTEGFSKTSAYLQDNYQFIGQGGASMWFQFSIKKATFTALLLAISAFVINDYVVYFKSLSKK
jgi:hypothetical protein